MKLTAQNLQDILEIAKKYTKNPINDEWGYDVKGYHFYVTVAQDAHDESFWWMIEPNKLDEDGCAEPCGDIVWVEYKDCDRLLDACKELAERYFEEV